MRISIYQLDKFYRRSVLVFSSYPTITCDEARDVKSSLLLLSYGFVFGYGGGVETKLLSPSFSCAKVYISAATGCPSSGTWYRYVSGKMMDFSAQ